MERIGGKANNGKGVKASLASTNGDEVVNCGIVWVEGTLEMMPFQMTWSCFATSGSGGDNNSGSGGGSESCVERWNIEDKDQGEDDVDVDDYGTEGGRVVDWTLDMQKLISQDEIMKQEWMN